MSERKPKSIRREQKDLSSIMEDELRDLADKTIKDVWLSKKGDAK